MLAKPKKKVRCLHCKTPAKWRGVCVRHYMLFLRQRDAGETTDERQVAAGDLLPAQKGPRRSAERRKFDAKIAMAVTK